MNFELFRSGGETFKMRFYVGHDGSMIRLAALLGFGKNGPLRWPALGSEIMMEVIMVHFRMLIHTDPSSGLEDVGRLILCTCHA